MKQDKRLESLCRDEEEKILLSRVKDAIQSAQLRMAPKYLGFLSLSERTLVQQAISMLGFSNGHFYGGYEQAERVLFGALPDYMAVSYTHLDVYKRQLMISLSAENYTTLIAALDTLSTLGIDAEDFGSNTLLVRAMPMYLQQEDIQELLEELAGKLSGGIHDLTPEKLDGLYPVSYTHLFPQL